MEMEAKVTTGCPLCEKIWNSKEEYQNFVGDHWEEKNTIVMEYGKPYLYIPIEMDDYYSDTYMQINYCPKCGRRLTPEYKACANAEMAIEIFEFIKGEYEKRYQDAGIQKYVEALQMGIDALKGGDAEC